MSLVNASKIKRKNDQTKSGVKRTTKNQLSDSDEEHGEHKIDDNDSDLDTLSGGCPDDSNAACIYCERLFFLLTREKGVCIVSSAKCNKTQNVEFVSAEKAVCMCN